MPIYPEHREEIQSKPANPMTHLSMLSTQRVAENASQTTSFTYHQRSRAFSATHLTDERVANFGGLTGKVADIQNIGSKPAFESSILVGDRSRPALGFEGWAKQNPPLSNVYV